jgi:hypothetical protein
VLPTPAGLYDWELVRISDSAVVDSGNHSNSGSTQLLTINNVAPATAYQFRLKTNCGGGSFSTTQNLNVTTP